METRKREQGAIVPDATVEFLESIRVRCGAPLPLDDFVTIVSNAYHEVEAPFYDEVRSELLQMLIPVLESFLSKSLGSLPGNQLQAVDVGCGTGFASVRLMERARARMGELVCVDLSPHMLERCRQKLKGNPKVHFLLGGVEALGDQEAGFDLVISCSVVHHMLQVPSFLARVSRLVKPGGFYLMLHEPSRRFYRNPACNALMVECSARARKRPWHRYVDPRAYVRTVRRMIQWRGLSPTQEQTSRLLQERGVTERPLRDEEIAVLVDVHAPPLRPEEWPGWQGGLDAAELKANFVSALTLVEFRSYGFLGPLYKDRVPRQCWQKAQRLAERFPEDGANFCALWRKPENAEPARES